VIRLAVPTIEDDDIQAVVNVLRSGFLVQGPNVKAFEEVYAAYVGNRHAVAVHNCTCALWLSLLALGVGAGDRVAVCTYSWPATANAIRATGADPVFVEIERETFNMDPNALETVLGRETGIKAVIPVHTFGGSADIRTLVAVANRAGIPLVEDAACALGTELGEKRAGSFGRLGCFSLHPRKAITTGEGGMITTDDDALARTVRMLRNHGQDPDAAKPDFLLPGHNLRMTDFQGALGLSQMKKAERIIAARIAAARRYDGLLEDTDVRPPRALSGSRHVYQSYVVLLPEDLRGKRDDVIAAMRRRDIETTLGTYHQPLIRYYREWGGFKRGDFPVTDDVSERALTLPMFEHVTLPQQQTVIASLLDSLAEVRAAR
jgi:dTDP-4-amino-4,6-dideoxygalactose transaminase